MGISVKTLSRLLWLSEQGLLQPGASIMELGAQQLYCSGAGAFLQEFVAAIAAKNPSAASIREYSSDEIAAMADGGFMANLMTACGFNYSAIDIFEAERTIIFDLNGQEPTGEMLNRYDLITNFGTTEHIVNQYLAMKTIHEIAKPGGIIYHDLPMGGYHTHGYFSYSPLLFIQLAEANDYEVLMQAYSKSGELTPAPDYMTRNGFPEAGFHDFAIEFIFRKTVDAPFRIPLETSTSLGASQITPEILDSKGATDAATAGAAGIRYGTSIHLSGYSGWELQRELVQRYKRRLLRFFLNAR